MTKILKAIWAASARLELQPAPMAPLTFGELPPLPTLREAVAADWQAMRGDWDKSAAKAGASELISA